MRTSVGSFVWNLTSSLFMWTVWSKFAVTRVVDIVPNPGEPRATPETPPIIATVAMAVRTRNRLSFISSSFRSVQGRDVRPSHRWFRVQPRSFPRQPRTLASRDVTPRSQSVPGRPETLRRARGTGAPREILVVDLSLREKSRLLGSTEYARRTGLRALTVHDNESLARLPQPGLDRGVPGVGARLHHLGSFEESTGHAHHVLCERDVRQGRCGFLRRSRHEPHGQAQHCRCLLHELRPHQSRMKGVHRHPRALQPPSQLVGEQQVAHLRSPERNKGLEPSLALPKSSLEVEGAVTLITRDGALDFRRPRSRLVSRNGPRWLVANMASRPSEVTVLVLVKTAALLITTSSPPCVCSNSLANRRIEAGEERSATASSTDWPPAEEVTRPRAASPRDRSRQNHHHVLATPPQRRCGRQPQTRAGAGHDAHPRFHCVASPRLRYSPRSRSP